ncbi:exosortase F-associated protein [Flavobacterium gillisiae]|uniref:Exosortase F-associated protein n=1 Tax=Flavobacterium gillisiae TaxID=150146 RepID=A0A1H3X5Q9_9FLAO|nr:exosortase F system-associated protein [Flavobacterium gillisiae]SDZ94729.1 exosortase F-associated protein [Flavobacterium gillisiae]
MLKTLLSNKLRVFLGLVLVVLFATIRAYEDQLFYDPFLNYFKSDFNALPLPSYNPFHLLMGLLFRYGLNTILSLGLIYVLFRDSTMIKFASFLYAFFFVFFVSLFYTIIYFYGANNDMVLFYVRRFLIQPIFVILFIPAFYYQKLNN